MKVLAGLCLDLVALGGLGLAVFGVYQLSPPAAFITGGVTLAAVGTAAARKVAKL